MKSCENLRKWRIYIFQMCTIKKKINQYHKFSTKESPLYNEVTVRNVIQLTKRTINVQTLVFHELTNRSILRLSKFCNSSYRLNLSKKLFIYITWRTMIATFKNI